MDTNKRRALGKGLEELFNNEQIDFNKMEEKIVASTPKEEIVEVNINELRSNPYQPRKIFDEEKLQELASSIKEHGVFQPIIIKKSIKGYEIIAGERRVKACERAGLTTIPAIIRNFDDTNNILELSILENLQRENLTSIEEANAYKKLLDNLALTQDELAKKLGKSRSHITNMLGLLNLPDEVKNLINENKISMSHARVLSKLEDKEKIDEFVQKILEEDISVRDIEELSRQSEVEKKHKVNRKPVENKFSHLEDELSEKLGTRVKVKKNRVEINFTNVNDLNRILEIMNLND